MFNIGDVMIHEVHESEENICQYVANFPTKVHWAKPSQYEYIETGIEVLRQQIEAYKITSIALPALGCGLGKLDFDEVKEIVVSYLKDLDCKIYLYKPF